MRTPSTATLLLTTFVASLRLDAATPSTAWKEVIRPNEAAEFARDAQTINTIQRKQAERAGVSSMRGFHAKSHSALQAELRVLPDLPSHARFGVFAESKTYPVWVRFSNGQGLIQGDRKGDVRGLAIKVIGAKGPMLLEGDESAITQDFLMQNGPSNPARDGRQFMAFAEGSVNLLTMPAVLASKVGAKEALRMLAALAKQTSRRVGSMATETFWSDGAIKFGPYAVRYVCKPVNAQEASLTTFGSTDYLRLELENRLRKGDIRYDFFLQYFVDEARTPIDDPSVEWKESDAPPVKVAELLIKRRDLASPASTKENELGNKFAYTPWHAPEDLRPIGHLQRLRRAGYAASARFRHRAPEPTAPARFE